MRFKIFGVLAAAALLSACASDPVETGMASGAGNVADAKPVETYTAPLGSTIAAGSQEDLVVNVGDRVFFGFDEYTLDGKSRAVLDKQAAWLSANPSVTISIEGHCDERGTREYNLALGERRANSAKDYLVQLGVNPSRVRTISYGKERPVALGSTEGAWAQNRRSVTVVGNAGS
ncbi:MAG: peptidoglycan-associated lipoprotein Pal [Rhodospirillales bacterium]|nr:peptidoglycan-associated lipoprotein Pal [Rhodospirillales bacterium]